VGNEFAAMPPGAIIILRCKDESPSLNKIVFSLKQRLFSSGNINNRSKYRIKRLTLVYLEIKT
jgi:hypothetical protein